MIDLNLCAGEHVVTKSQVSTKYQDAVTELSKEAP